LQFVDDDSGLTILQVLHKVLCPPGGLVPSSNVLTDGSLPDCPPALSTALRSQRRRYVQVHDNPNARQMRANVEIAGSNDMTDQVKCPDLPLMLAGVPRPVKELLREAGIPAAPLPDVPLLAAGAGRFVLFDSKNSRSAAQARRAASGGLEPIDLRALVPASGNFQDLSPDHESGWGMAAECAVAKTFLEHLKLAVEALEGAWVRLSDYPFPYQSAICVGVEHVSEELADFTNIAQTLPGMATHFVSSRLRADRLAQLSLSRGVDLGWQILASDCKSSPRSTLSHWTTRFERFTAAKLLPAGLAMTGDRSQIPGINRLLQLGLRYSCHPSPGVACRAESQSRGAPDAAWIRFSTLTLPPAERFLEWVGEHYQSGCPLFLAATTARIELIKELLRLSGDVDRCSLMWQTSFGEFARWWAHRRRMKLQVWRTESGYEIHAATDFAGDSGSFPLAVEIWRGTHRATLPLRQSEVVVPDEGLVYLQSPKRNPAGCTTPGDNVRNLVADQQ
jgi:hypothetical protein